MPTNVQPKTTEIISPFDGGSSDGGVAGDGQLSDGEIRNHTGGYEALEAMIAGSGPTVRGEVFDRLDDLAKLGVAGAKVQRGDSVNDYIQNIPDPYGFVSSSRTGASSGSKDLASNIEKHTAALIDNARSAIRDGDPIGARAALVGLASLRVGLAEHARSQRAQHLRGSRELHETVDWWNRERDSSRVFDLRPAWEVERSDGLAGPRFKYSAESASADAVPPLDDQSLSAVIAELDAAVVTYREAMAYDDPSPGQQAEQAEQALEQLARRLQSVSVAAPLKGRVLASCKKTRQASLAIFRINRESTTETRVAREVGLSRGGTLQFD